MSSLLTTGRTWKSAQRSRDMDTVRHLDKEEHTAHDNSELSSQNNTKSLESKKPA